MSYPFPQPHIYTEAEAKASDLHSNKWSVFVRCIAPDRYIHHSLVNTIHDLYAIIDKHSPEQLLIVECEALIKAKQEAEQARQEIQRQARLRVDPPYVLEARRARRNQQLGEQSLGLSRHGRSRR